MSAQPSEQISGQAMRHAIGAFAAVMGAQDAWLHFDTGIANSAPLGVLAGQRCITLFCLV